MEIKTPETPSSGIFADLKSPWLMYLKAALFLTMGLLCSAAIFVQNPSFLTFALLAFTVWSFCRLYYFFFYVIEKYIDPSFRFDSFHSAIIFLIKRNKASKPKPGKESETLPPDA
jgi:tellurite resistance protein TehA-like permease